MGAAVGLTQYDTLKMHVCIDEYNGDVLVLAQTLLPQFTPASKHYGVKIHQSRERFIDLGIVIQKISKIEQLEDICTKCLTVATFQYLRKKLMGW